MLKLLHGVEETEFGSEQQVDVVDVLAATEAMGEVVAGIDGGAEFTAVVADETETTVNVFGVRAFAIQLLDDEGHGQIVTQGPQQLAGDHVGGLL